MVTFLAVVGAFAIGAVTVLVLSSHLTRLLLQFFVLVIINRLRGRDDLS